MKPSVVVTNYGIGRNSVLLVNQSILEGIEKAGLLAPDGDLTFRGDNPDDRYKYRSEAASLFSTWLDKHEAPDVLVAQASFAADVFRVAMERCPNTLRVLQRDSTHAGYRKRTLDEEYERLGMSVREPAEITNTELHEYEQAHAITVLSRYVERTFRDNGLGHKVRYTSPQTIDLKRWPVFPRDPDNIRFRVLFGGQIVVRKAAHQLFEAWRRLEPREDEELVLAGVVGEPGERADFMNAEMKRTPRVRTEWRDIYQMWKSYAACDVYCLPSLEEGSSCTCIEALACGRPLVASDCCGSDLLEQHDDIGMLFPAGDVDALTAALQWYREHPDKRVEHGRRAREVAAAAGGMERFGSDYARVIVDLWNSRER